nr:uncharacterized protein LOC109187360 [Ipomoea batatas]
MNFEEWTIEYEGIHLVCFKCGKYGHRHEQCGREEENEDAGHNDPTTKNTKPTDQGVSEKYGSWMLVNRKERRNQYRRPNQPAHGPPTNRRQFTPMGQAPASGIFETQSRRRKRCPGLRPILALIKEVLCRVRPATIAILGGRRPFDKLNSKTKAQPKSIFMKATRQFTQGDDRQPVGEDPNLVVGVDTRLPIMEFTICPFVAVTNLATVAIIGGAKAGAEHQTVQQRKQSTQSFVARIVAEISQPRWSIMRMGNGSCLQWLGLNTHQRRTLPTSAAQTSLSSTQTRL